MLQHIAMLEGAAEKLPGGREAAVVRSKLQEARLAETERLRVDGASPVELALLTDSGLERGRGGVSDFIMRAMDLPAAGAEAEASLHRA